MSKKKVKIDKSIVDDINKPAALDDILIESGLSGATTKIFINGQQISNACVLDFHAEARGLNTLTLVLFPKIIKIKGNALLVEKEYKFKKKPIVVQKEE